MYNHFDIYTCIITLILMQILSSLIATLIISTPFSTLHLMLIDINMYINTEQAPPFIISVHLPKVNLDQVSLLFAQIPIKHLPKVKLV